MGRFGGLVLACTCAAVLAAAPAQSPELLSRLASARAELVPQARAQDIYTDEDVFAIVS